MCACECLDLAEGRSLVLEAEPWHHSGYLDKSFRAVSTLLPKSQAKGTAFRLPEFKSWFSLFY